MVPGSDAVLDSYGFNENPYVNFNSFTCFWASRNNIQLKIGQAVF